MSAPAEGTTFTIAHLSDLHCGGQYFVPGLLERAISEINDLEPDIVVCSGDLTTFGFKHEYEEARRYLDKVECDVDGRDPGQPRLAQRRLRPFRAALRRSQLRAPRRRRHGRRGRLDRARPRSRPDRAGPLPLDRGAVRRGGGKPARLRVPPPPAARAGHRARAERDLRRGRHDRVPAARRRPSRAVGPQARPLRVEAREPLRGQHRHGLVAAPPGQHAALLQRRRGVAGAMSPSGASTRSTARSGSSSSRSTRSSTRSTRAGSRTRSGLARDAACPGVDRRRALRAGREVARSRSSRTTSSPLISSAAPRSCARARDYGVAVVDDLDEALAEHRPALVVDLSDEPVLGPRERFRFASRVLAAGLPYVGADFRFDPPAAGAVPAAVDRDRRNRQAGRQDRDHRSRRSALCARPEGRRRRDGAGWAARARGRRASRRISTTLLELSRAGRHAASDYLETAALAGVETIGCRRCGGGLAGSVSTSNVHAGARLAVELAPDLVLFDGSGAAFPPVQTSRRILVVNAQQDPDVVTGYLNEYRHLVSDLVILTMAEPGSGWEELSRPRARAGPEGDRDDVAPEAGRADRGPDGRILHDRTRVGARGLRCAPPRGVRRRRRPRLRQPRRPREAAHASWRRVEAEVFLVELKAAAIDVVAEAASERGVDVVLAGSDVSTVDGEDLDAELLRLAEEART